MVSSLVRKISSSLASSSLASRYAATTESNLVDSSFTLFSAPTARCVNASFSAASADDLSPPQMGPSWRLFRARYIAPDSLRSPAAPACPASWLRFEDDGRPRTIGNGTGGSSCVTRLPRVSASSDSCGRWRTTSWRPARASFMALMQDDRSDCAVNSCSAVCTAPDSDASRSAWSWATCCINEPKFSYANESAHVGKPVYVDTKQPAATRCQSTYMRRQTCIARPYTRT